jgi:predicted phage terminase large subunit-like protein
MQNEFLTLQAKACKTSFKVFVEYFWDLVSPTEYVSGLHSEAIIEHVDALAKGQFKRLVICCPIRHGKSLLLGVLAPAWLWTREPTTRILSCTFKQGLTERDSLRTRQLIESARYQELFGNLFTLQTDQSKKAYYTNNQGGHRISQSVQGGLGGDDADFLILDDLISITDRRSPVIKENVWDYYRMAKKRLVLSGKDRCILSGHRYSDDDVFARLKSDTSDTDEWVWLVLPAECDHTINKGFYNPIWSDPRQPGELLWPDWYTREKIEAEKKDLKWEYPAIFQQDPQPIPGENLFRPEWFKDRYTLEDGKYKLKDVFISVDKCRRIATCDLAISQQASADTTVIQVWDVTPHQHMILVHQWQARADGPTIVAAFKRIQADYNPIAFWVEAIGYQSLMVQLLRQEGLPVKELHPGGKDKIARSQRAQVKAESRQVWLPLEAEWVEDWITEVRRFPMALHDDIVDALSYAAIIASKYPKESLEPQDTFVKNVMIGDTHEYKTSDNLTTMIEKIRALNEVERNKVAALNGSFIKLRCETEQEFSKWVNAYEKALAV